MRGNWSREGTFIMGLLLLQETPESLPFLPYKVIAKRQPSGKQTLICTKLARTLILDLSASKAVRDTFSAAYKPSGLWFTKSWKVFGKELGAWDPSNSSQHLLQTSEPLNTKPPPGQPESESYPPCAHVLHGVLSWAGMDILSSNSREENILFSPRWGDQCRQTGVYCRKGLHLNFQAPDIALQSDWFVLTKHWAIDSLLASEVTDSIPVRLLQNPSCTELNSVSLPQIRMLPTNRVSGRYDG